MRRALHLGVQKALGVVWSHYEVNFEAVASGYVVPEGVEDEVAMEQVDALAADAAEALTEDFLELGLGTKNREPRTEPKEPGTGTERTGTEKIGSCSVPDSLEPKFPGSSVRFLG
jgi:hypothetical protein